MLYLGLIFAGVAQLVEQLICNQQVAGSSPIASSIKKAEYQIPLFHFKKFHTSHTLKNGASGFVIS